MGARHARREIYELIVVGGYESLLMIQAGLAGLGQLERDVSRCELERRDENDLCIA